MQVRRPLLGCCAWIALVLAACDASIPADTVVHPAIGILNGTPFPVTLVIDGTPVADFDAGGPLRSFDPEALPTLPWDVEARSPSGRVLSSVHVTPADVTQAIASDGTTSIRSVFDRTDLSCGSVTIWVGGLPPSGPGPVPPPPSPDDCAP